MVNKTDVLDEGTSRTKGTDALTSNIEAAKMISSIVKTTLGPMGMDKMLIDNMGDTIVTNDGVKILKEMDIEHPGAKMLVEVARTQENEVGDGTTTAVILSGELLSNAKDLIDKKIHPTIVIRGFKMASVKALKIIADNAVEVDIKSKDVILQVCETAMTGKVAEYSKSKLSELLYDTFNMVGYNGNFSKESIKVHKVVGGDVNDSFLMEGIVLDRDVANPNMPNFKKDAKILLIDFPLEVRELDANTNIAINSPEEYNNFLLSEHNYLKSIAYKIKDLGIDFVACQKGIDDNVAYYLAKEGIIATRRTRNSDMKKLSLALRVPILSTIDDIDSVGFGCADISVKNILDEKYVFIENVKNSRVATLVLKASTKQVIDEIERAIDDAIGDVLAIFSSKKIVAGGGAIEVEVYKELLKYAKTFEGKEQMIITAFAQAFLSIPKTLCENCGFDEIETIAKMISNHEKGLKFCGLDGFTGVVDNTISNKIIEPVNIKNQALKSASEIVSMILRIDDVIAAKKISKDSINI